MDTRCRRLGALVILLFATLLVRPTAVGAEAAWTTAASPAENHAGQSAILLPDGSVLVAGLKTAERYDPSADRWSPAGALTTYRSGHTVTLLPNGQVLLVGGFALPFDGTAATERYDPTTEAWTAAAPLATSRISHTATLLRDGTVLVVGGTPDAKNTGLATTERYDPATDRWTPAASLASTRVGHTATLLPDGSVLVVGGITLGGGVGTFVATAERYDPVSDRWTSAGSPSTGRSGHQATLLSDGRVLITGVAGAAGGASATAAQITETTELYDPATNSWRAGARLTTARVAHSATLLANGQVLVAGGNPPAASATTELYDPATGQWSASALMSSGSLGHTATLLADGRVLAIHQTTTEIYTLDTAGPPQQCFAETSQCVRGRFLAYWQAHGGLAVNGYPISAELAQTLEDGQSHIVQYFERTRLEYHPRNAAPYDLLLGQFGRRILADVPGAPVAPVAARPGDTFFPETGHNVGPRFATYWAANGGLALFGYPLSEPFEQQLEDGKTYTVQYFERARFELHPENGAPYDILLGQFGRQILAESQR